MGFVIQIVWNTDTIFSPFFDFVLNVIKCFISNTTNGHVSISNVSVFQPFKKTLKLLCDSHCDSHCDCSYWLLTTQTVILSNWTNIFGAKFQIFYAYRNAWCHCCNLYCVRISDNLYCVRISIPTTLEMTKMF